MIIKNLKIRYEHDFDYKEFNFDDKIMFFKSDKNAKGKTTFLRGLLYALGFNVPNTKKVDFARYEFVATIVSYTGDEMIIWRHNSIIKINDIPYSYPADYEKVISVIWHINNCDLIDNILGAIYFDQEKGWTLLNRGKIIGDNGFNVESFLRGLNDCDGKIISTKIKEISNEIKKYKLMKNISEYQEEIDAKAKPLSTTSFNEDLEMKISILTTNINNLTSKINEFQRIKKSNVDFVNYIDSLGLQVKIDGKIYIITKKELVEFVDLNAITDLEINNLIIEREKYKKEKSELIAQRKPIMLFDIDTALETFSSTLKNININNLQVDKIIESLEKSRSELNKELTELTKKENQYIKVITEKIKQYWYEFEMEIEYKDDLLFTHDLKSLSGAILYKMIVIYKLSYIFALQQKINRKIPIFIDSPAGREVEMETIEKTLSIIKRDFSDNQLFICTIFDFKSFTLTDNQVLLFNELRPFDKKDMLD